MNNKTPITQNTVELQEILATINNLPEAGEGGREPIVEPLSVTENGTYIPSEGVDGFNIVTVNVPTEGGSGGGIIDVTELPTSNIDENAVYRVTESYKSVAPNVWVVMPDEETGEMYAGTLFEAIGVNYNIYVVDELPADMKIVDAETATELEIYVLTTDGIAYINVLGMGVVPLGLLFFEEEGFDKGITDNVYAETEMGVYSTFDSYEQIIRWFVRENGEWREISAHIDEYFPNGVQDITVLSGEYTKGEEIVVTQNATTIDIADKIINDKSIPTVVVDTPSVAELVMGHSTDKDRLTITDDYFRDNNGEYIYKIRAGAFSECFVDDIVVPETVYEIGAYAFNGCRAHTVSLPDSASVIPREMFAYSQIDSIRLPEQLKEIRQEAFRNSDFNQQLPDSVERIEDYAFYGCRLLTHISLPKSLLHIGGWVFNYCSELKTVTFNSKPEFANSAAFYDCENLTTINVPWSEGEVANAPWGAPNATINYNYTGG